MKTNKKAIFWNLIDFYALIYQEKRLLSLAILYMKNRDPFSW